VSGATRDLVQKLPSSIDANVIRVSKATVKFLERTFPCTIMLMKECLLFSTPGYHSKIQGDSIPLHEVIRCQVRFPQVKTGSVWFLNIYIYMCIENHRYFGPASWGKSGGFVLVERDRLLQ
jgi:hypothetical protein